MDSDIFVTLSYCQFEKNNYQNRFNMDDHWYTLSVHKGLDPIIEKEYITPYEDWKKIKKQLPEYDLSIFDECISLNLSETNIKIIKKIAKLLDIKTKIVEDYETNLTKEERLIDICKTYEAITYLSGTTGQKYMDLKKFEKNNIKVIFQNEKQKIKIPILKILKDKNYV